MRTLCLLALLCLPVTVQATPVTVSLLGSSCLWCLDGTLTLDQTDQGWVFADAPQQVTTTYLGVVNNDWTRAAELSRLIDFQGWGTGHDALLFLGVTADRFAGEFWATVGPLPSQSWSLSFTEYRAVPFGSGVILVDQAASLLPIPAVIEPPTWLLLLSGLGVIGWMTRRTR